MLQALNYYHVYARRIAATLAGVCAVSVFLYGALLLMAVSHAAHLSSVQGHIKSLTKQLSAQESEYLTLTKALNQQTATQLGLVVPTSVSIVYASSPSVLTFNR